LAEYLAATTTVRPDWLRALISYDKSDDLEIQLTTSEAKQVVEKIRSMRMLDPACGSGAFPIGMLQKLTYLLEIVDPDCELWIEAECSDVSAEMRRAVRQSLSKKGAEYVRKLGVIRRCIYGVDIQSIATEIARLRCFLTLIVDEVIDDSAPNRGIEPLPNLEFKFVAADSLLGLKGAIAESGQSELLENTSHLSKLEEIRGEYFASTTLEKLDLKQEFKRVQANMRRGVAQSHAEASLMYERLARWEPFSHGVTEWFDSAWMFGVEQFDIVLANPPYLGEKGHKELFQKVKEGSLGRFYSKNMDLFYFFFHHAINLARDGGVIAFITTNYFPTATGGSALRRDLFERAAPIELVNFKDLKIFDAAPGQHNLISILRRGRSDGECRVVTAETSGSANATVLAGVLSAVSPFASAITRKSGLFDVGNSHYIRLSATTGESFEAGEAILSRIAESEFRLGTICNVRQGLLSNPDKVKPKHLVDNPRLRASAGDGIFVVSPSDGDVFDHATHARPYFKNSDIARYWTSREIRRKVLYLADSSTPDSVERAHLRKFKALLEARQEFRDGQRPWYQLHRPREERVFEDEKLVCPQRSYLNTFGYSNSSWYASADVYFILANDPRFNLKVILGLLNSKLYYFWLYHRGKRKGEMLELFQVPLSEIPIPSIPKQLEGALLEGVNRCIREANSGRPLDDLQDELDGIVYSLFNLSTDQIRVVEEAWRKTTSSRVDSVADDIDSDEDPNVP